MISVMALAAMKMAKNKAARSWRNKWHHENCNNGE
jgi:hypothetical protein